MKSVLAGVSALALACGMAGAAVAQTTDEAADELDVLIVTGTRMTGLRAVDSPAPIQVLDETALARVAQNDLIQAIAQNVPSFNARRSAATRPT